MLYFFSKLGGGGASIAPLCPNMRPSLIFHELKNWLFFFPYFYSFASVVTNVVFHTGIKCKVVDYDFTCDLITNGSLKVQFVWTENETAIIFTKGLASSRFLLLWNKLMVHSLPTSVSVPIQIHSFRDLRI